MITCDTTLYTVNDWLIARLSKEASAQLPSHGQVAIEGTANDHPFKTPVEPDGEWGHWFRVDEQLQKAWGVANGSALRLVFTTPKNWPEPVVPADLQKALEQHPAALSLWCNITTMARWEWLRWIGSTSNPTTRFRRIGVTCSKLNAGKRRPCCFNRSMCCVPNVSKNGVLIPKPEP